MVCSGSNWWIASLVIVLVLLSPLSNGDIVQPSCLPPSQGPREDLTVRIEQGILEGRRVVSAAEGTFVSFQGIPYAKSPVGPLRFKDAEPPEKWDGVRPAYSEGNICPQEGLGVAGNEDCLFLNIYTSQWPPSAESLPVMVWIHGGGFVRGSGNNDTYGPDYLVSEGVIVVTINYRLGELGFLYLNEAAPGNVGLKDQVAALRWVQRNIGAFGGDSGKVTIFGQSAGGASVHLLMLSPLSNGLFHAAIAQSGSAINQWAIQSEPVETSRRLARAVGCPVGNDSSTVDCLRTIDIEPLIKAAFSQAATEKDNERIMLFTFVPTVDLPVPGVETFLPAPAIQLINEGRHKAVPFLSGFNNNESILHSFFMNYFDENVARKLDGAWNLTILPELRLPANGSRNEEALQELRNFYMDGKPLTNATMQGFMNMLTDIAFAEGIYYSLRKMAEYNTAPLYEYSFILDDILNAGKAESNTTYGGAGHGDDLGYIFRMSFLNKVPVNSSAYRERERMVHLWTNFAKYQNPTPTNDTILHIQWNRYGNSRNFLEIGSELHSGTEVNEKRVKFWERFYETYG